jgi:hypothetical protein
MPKYNVFVSYTSEIEEENEARALTKISYDLHYVTYTPKNITMQARDSNEVGVFGQPLAEPNEVAEVATIDPTLDRIADDDIPF